MSARQQTFKTHPKCSHDVSLESDVSDFSTTMSRPRSEQVLSTLDVNEGSSPAPITRKIVSYNKFTGNSSLVQGYSKPPLDRPPPLQARPSTRELISKYEAISSSRRSPPPLDPAHHILDIQGRDRPVHDILSPIKAKTQGPFSLRNIFAVFSKKNKKSIRQVSPVAITRTEDDSLASTPPSYTGPAFYLSASSSPTWRPCSLSLHRSHLALIFADDSQHITHTIPLSSCVDVASLASHQLGGEIPILSVNEDGKPSKVAHVFEMTLESCKPAKERFSTWSVVERSRWVSALWDAILLCRDPKTSQSGFYDSSVNDSVRRPPLKVVNITGQLSLSGSSPSAPSLLPAVTNAGEINTDEVQDTTSQPINSASTTPIRRPHRSASELSSVRSSIPSSPSIRTLGSMSIVRQRIAQLDGQDRPPNRLPGRISSPGGCIALSTKRLPSIKVTDRRRDFNDEDSQETSFSALDAHAMYHQSPGESDTESRYSDATDTNSGVGFSTHEPPRDLTMATEDVDSLGSDVQALMRSFLTNVAQQSSQMSGLVDKLASLDDGINNFFTHLKDMPQQSASGPDVVLIHKKLDQIKKEMAELCLTENIVSLTRPRSPAGLATLANESQTKDTASSDPDLSLILRKLEELRAELGNDLPLMLHKLGQNSSTTPSTNITTGIAEMHTKLDGLIASITPFMDKFRESFPHELIADSAIFPEALDDGHEEYAIDKMEDAVSREPLPNPVNRLLELLQVDQESRETQAQQQTDTVRYLNDLNTWLENFVQSSTGNMRQLTAGVDLLCKEWLPVSEPTQTTADYSGSHSDEMEGVTRLNNAFSSLQGLIAKEKEKGEEMRSIQTAIQTLSDIVKEDIAKNSEARMELMRQAQVQENLLNGLTVELTKEIRGERLRFVDAMKDATSLNVAIHVEEFKQVLGKLHHEKVVLEQQIAELFSFVAKQNRGHPSIVMGAPKPSSRPLPQIGDKRLSLGHVEYR